MDQHFAEMLSDSKTGDAITHDHDHKDSNEEHMHGYSDRSTISTADDHKVKHAAGVSGTPVRRHGHDRLGARSVGLDLAEGPIDWGKFKTWLKGFLEEEGERIWRLKGVLWTTSASVGHGGHARGGTTTAWGSHGAGSRTVVQVISWGRGGGQGRFAHRDANCIFRGNICVISRTRSYTTSLHVCSP